MNRNETKSRTPKDATKSMYIVLQVTTSEPQANTILGYITAFYLTAVQDTPSTPVCRSVSYPKAVLA